MNTVTEPNAGLACDLRGWQQLSHLGVLRFAGPDAAGFLQGQLSNDTRRLGKGMPVLAALSNPQGRVVAVLHLLPHSSGVLAILPRELAQPTLERLRKYVLRSKVAIENLSDRFPVAGACAGPRIGQPAERAQRLADCGYAEHAGIGVARVGQETDRWWAVGDLEDLRQCGFQPPPADHSPAPAEDAKTAAAAAWRLADVRAGLPQIYAATSELFVAQMLNLDLIDGISFTKGCFTGQEIIARTQHLGRIKRRLHRLLLPAGSWTVGQAIRLADGRSGRLTEAVPTREGCEALAVLTLDRDSTEPDSATGETAAVQLPLPYAVGAADSAAPAQPAAR